MNSIFLSLVLLGQVNNIFEIETSSQIRPAEEVSFIEVSTIEELDVIKKRGHLIFGVFGAEWCSNCKTAEPIVKPYIKDKRLKNVRFVYIDIDKSPKLVTRFKIDRVPTYIYRNERKVGSHKLKEWIERVISKKRAIKSAKNKPIQVIEQPVTYQYQTYRYCVT